LALAKLAHEAGIPAGVINVVPTNKANSSKVGLAICESEKVGALSFTGSTNVGKLLLKQCAGKCFKNLKI
jgi:acyl-CoA reductase-like NAD-dependent aldehyde dehydrogenase